MKNISLTIGATAIGVSAAFAGLSQLSAMIINDFNHHNTTQSYTNGRPLTEDAAMIAHNNCENIPFKNNPTRKLLSCVISLTHPKAD